MNQRVDDPRPTRRQYRLARAVVSWYLDSYHWTKSDVGTAGMFCDPEKVGYFAADQRGFRRGEGSELFKILVATAMFQRRQDVQIMRILRRIPEERVHELTNMECLHCAVEESRCRYIKTVEGIHRSCDLGKGGDGRGRCFHRPRTPCHLKEHTELLKRYGHFGKVPTSIALAIKEAGASDLADLYGRVLKSGSSPWDRAVALQSVLTKAWRVSDKISAMFLSAVTNPGLTRWKPPWSIGVDWTRFVVIDSNVDLFLAQIGYPGPWTYGARQCFIRRLSRRIDLTACKPSLQRFNPRVVQQALYLFMSKVNRVASGRDCLEQAPRSCAQCPGDLRRLCPVRA